ncbi:hypothetical protein J8I26_10585 [Herbaspirillum sp. LeCh32-8]|uniref:hypothetical protein n=1 Tax=Herbaspirillum sp. LeCh32-8 TaxID=2821356 RepID=UPI001AE4BA6A|nr:hypothetical protein [Herbaspirillum sp. LeCh32-8]MBP0598552.1 hypothetical protein [Herbaspirillum sp. LeCh32-8]
MSFPPGFFLGCDHASSCGRPQSPRRPGAGNVAAAHLYVAYVQRVMNPARKWVLMPFHANRIITEENA